MPGRQRGQGPSIMPQSVLETLAVCCITNETYRTVLTIWVWPWLKEEIRGLIGLLEIIELLKPFLLPMMQVMAICLYWQIFPSSFWNSLVCNLIPNSALSKQLTPFSVPSFTDNPSSGLSSCIGSDATQRLHPYSPTSRL